MTYGQLSVKEKADFLAKINAETTSVKEMGHFPNQHEQLSVEASHHNHLYSCHGGRQNRGQFCQSFGYVHFQKEKGRVTLAISLR
jgi:hypothetical protein